jgi:hypothetical protein
MVLSVVSVVLLLCVVEYRVVLSIDDDDKVLSPQTSITMWRASIADCRKKRLMDRILKTAETWFSWATTQVQYQT